MIDGYRLAAARADEVPALAAVERAAATRFPLSLLPAPMRDDTLPLPLLEAAQREGRLWVARDPAGTVAGFACACREGEAALLAEIDVHPAHGRRGIGRALLDTVIDWAQQAGAPALYLTTFQAFGPGMALYRRGGFSPLANEDMPGFVADILAAEAAAGLAGRVAMVRMLTPRPAPASVQHGEGSPEKKGPASAGPDCP